MTFLLQPHGTAHTCGRDGKGRAEADGGMEVMVIAPVGIIQFAAKIPNYLHATRAYLGYSCGQVLDADPGYAAPCSSGTIHFQRSERVEPCSPPLCAKYMPSGRRKGIATADFDVHGGRVGRGEDELHMVVGITEGQGAVECAKDGGRGRAKKLQRLVEEVCARVVEAAATKFLQGLPIPAAGKFGFGDAYLYDAPQQA